MLSAPIGVLLALELSVTDVVVVVGDAVVVCVVAVAVVVVVVIGVTGAVSKADVGVVEAFVEDVDVVEINGASADVILS